MCRVKYGNSPDLSSSKRNLMFQSLSPYLSFSKKNSTFQLFTPSLLQQWRALTVFIVAHGFVGNLSSTWFSSARATERTIASAVSVNLMLGFWSGRQILLAKKTFISIVIEQPIMILAVTVAILTLNFMVMMLFVSHQELKHSKAATPIAMDYLERGIQKGRIQEQNGYHLYLPSKTSYCEVVLVIVPGALLHHTVYARIAGAISDSGSIAVVVLHTEYPSCRHPCLIHSVGTKVTMERIRNEVDKEVNGTDLQQSLRLKWAVAGHSMGIGPAVYIFRELPWVHKLVTWGSYKELHSHNIGADCGDLLVIGASNDGFYFKSKEMKQRFMKSLVELFNNSFTYHEVKGGNHSGFADYPCQTFPVLDGEREITLEQQHKEVVSLTKDFLFSQKVNRNPKLISDAQTVVSSFSEKIID